MMKIPMKSGTMSQRREQEPGNLASLKTVPRSHREVIYLLFVQYN